MRYISTRDPQNSADLSEAITRGLAPDGGLYIPEQFPGSDPTRAGEDLSLTAVGSWLLRPFFVGDRLAGELEEICAAAFDFPVPVEPLRDGTAVLELFHGPTAAFKDVGARFLAECL